MSARYAEPLGRAWTRTKWSLFSPFDPGKWIVAAFAAWLANLGQRGGAPAWSFPYRDDDFWGNLGALPGDWHDWLLSPLGLGILALAACCGVCLAVFLMWVSSRGKFVFLDDVSRNRAAIAAPWREFRVEGNSLFLWRLLFGLLALAAAAILAAAIVLLWIGLGGEEVAGAGLVFLAVASVLAGLPVAVLVAYVYCFLEHFVVPIMYRDRVGAAEGWRRFLRLFRRRPWAFALYGLFLLVLYIGLLIAILVAGCATCCVGFLLLALPYVWAVILLPVLFTFRAFGPEFLSQFGPAEWTWPAVPTEAPPAAGGTGAPEA